MHGLVTLLLSTAAVALATTASADAPGFILDTDIGDDVDDAYALALFCSLPDITLLGVTTAFGPTTQRAELAAKLLKTFGRPDVPVCAGRPSEGKIGRQAEWSKGYRARNMLATDAVTFMKRQVDRAPGQVTIVAVGPLTNIGDLLTRHPEIKPKIKQIAIMGGAAYVGYNCQAPPVVEWNIRCDPPAARALFESGVPIVMAGLDVTAMLQLEEEYQKVLCAYGAPMTDALAALTKLWGNNVPVLFDPMALAYAAGHAFCDAERARVVVADDGMTRIAEGAPNATVLVRPRAKEFLDWYVATVGRGGRGRR